MPVVADLPTPALVLDAAAFARNLDLMAAARPGPRLRPHVKAHKTTAIARAQHARGHSNFTCATPAEVVGMARAGLGDDLLLANQCIDPVRLRAMADCDARVTVAVDSDATIAAAAANGIREVLVDVNVGMQRCGCAPDDAGRIADLARTNGLEVRGVMGYEGHASGVTDPGERSAITEAAMTLLERAHVLVGGDIVSAGGTGTYAMNTLATEIQAGSYALMDAAYEACDLPFGRALAIVATVLHVNDRGDHTRWVVADCGLKAHSLDHGEPSADGAEVWFSSDEHLTFRPLEAPATGAAGTGAPGTGTQGIGGPGTRLTVGDRVLVWPAHCDPTVALHERMYVAEHADITAPVTDEWAVDLRGWDVG